MPDTYNKDTFTWFNQMAGYQDLRDFSDALTASSSVKWGMGGGAATSIFGSLSNNDLLVIIGIVTTGLGFCVNLFYQYKRNKRAEEYYSLQKKLLEEQIKNEQKAGKH